MKTFRGVGYALMFAMSFAAPFALASCETPTTVTEYETVFVLPQHWVGVEYTWADSGPLNSDVEDHRRAGWYCGESLLDMPVWLPQDEHNSWFALVVAHFYLCTAEPVAR